MRHSALWIFLSAPAHSHRLFGNQLKSHVIVIIAGSAPSFRSRKNMLYLVSQRLKDYAN